MNHSSNWETHKLWAMVVLVIGVLFWAFCVYTYSHPFVIRFEMDDNTRDAIQSINYTALQAVKGEPLPPCQVTRHGWECNDQGICGDPAVWDLENSTIRVVT